MLRPHAGGSESWGQQLGCYPAKQPLAAVQPSQLGSCRHVSDDVWCGVALPQVGMQLHGEGFDEGVDIHEFEHWNP